MTGGARFPIGFAHRGGRGIARPNTLAAFAAALAAGARGLESDVWLTADGVVVLDHDGRFRRRAALRRRPVGALPRAALPGRVASLADLYRECGTDFELSLDVKDAAAVPQVLAAAARVGAAGRLWLVGGSGSAAGWRRAEPAVRPVAATADFRPSALAALADSGLAAVNLPRRAWSAARVAAVHGAGLLAFGWDAHTGRRVATLVALGLDGVYSDSVAALAAAGLTRPPAGVHVASG